MLVLKQQLKEARIPQAVVARAVDVSEATLAQIVNHNAWPRTSPGEVRRRLASWLESQGIDTTKSFDAVQGAATPRTAGTTDKTSLSEEENMLLKKQVLFPATKKAFGLFRDPFADEAMQGSDDVFTTPDIRYVREALYQTARHGGFMAVIGESGAGKSTLRRDLTERINRENAPVIVIEPYIIAMEDNDVKGKTLKAAAIAEAIISTIAPLESIRRSQDARFRQLHRVLKDSSQAGFSHVLVIEEAHSLPIPTLKHLKRFFELESGFKKLLSIVLIGQPELATKLSERNMEVREVVQRCEVVELLPLDNNLEEFLTFKLQRAGKQLTDIMDASAVDAIRARLSNPGSHRKNMVSLLYPLAVSNLVIAAMNLAAEIGVPQVNADVVLATKLSERNMEVREVVQRCEVVELLPLDNNLEEFLTFKLQRAGKQLTDIMDAGAVDAIRARLSNPGSHRKNMVSLLYPLAVSNLVIAAMNLAAEIGVPQVNADVVKGV